MSIAEIKRRGIASMVRIWGTVQGSDGSTVSVGGLARLAGLGDRISIETESAHLPGEVIAMDDRFLQVLLFSAPEGLRLQCNG